MEDLEWTGERLTTNLNNFHGVVEHLHRYALAQQIVTNKIVLDIASGEGYGTVLLSKYAKKVTGVDIDLKSVTHAKKKYYNEKNVDFLVGSTDQIPLASNSIDVVVSFETIEHHDQHDLMIQEIVRVLNEDGILIISSPEKSIYNKRDPGNPFHIKELNLSELMLLLKTHFSFVEVLVQKFVMGSLIHSVDLNCSSKFQFFDGNYCEIIPELGSDEFYNQPFFNVAICSNTNLQPIIQNIGNSLFNGVESVKKDFERSNSTYREKYYSIKNSKSYRFSHYFAKKLSFLLRLWKK